jgi:hypothetical protein
MDSEPIPQKYGVARQWHARALDSCPIWGPISVPGGAFLYLRSALPTALSMAPPSRFQVVGRAL